MLLATILLWALNLSVTKYILTHGLGPLPYATVRYADPVTVAIARASSAGTSRATSSPASRS